MSLLFAGTAPKCYVLGPAMKVGRHQTGWVDLQAENACLSTWGNECPSHPPGVQCVSQFSLCYGPHVCVPSSKSYPEVLPPQCDGIRVGPLEAN